MLREVNLPAAISSQLFLGAMPGRHQSFGTAEIEILDVGVHRVVCLAPLNEIRQKSPEYAHAIEHRSFSWVQEFFEIPDYGVPQDREAFWRLAETLAGRLRSGEKILIHCGAGIGRTGTLAVCILMALGVTRPEACKDITDAGAGPERRSQEDLVRWAAQRALQN
jgi:protein-tyrosine phosphatase